MTRRRAILRGASAAFLPLITPCRARPQGPPARIGYISLRPGPDEFDQAFVRGMAGRGWVQGQNLNVDFRWAAFDAERVLPLVTALLGLRPALMLCADVGVGAMRRLKSPAPMVHPAFGDAIAGGFSTSLSRPDGNVTGSSVLAIELALKRVELLNEAQPSLRRVAALYAVGANPPTRGCRPAWQPARNLASRSWRCPCSFPKA